MARRRKAAAATLPPPADDECRMHWRGQQSVALKDTTRELDVEGALRASKTTICLWKELNAYLNHPGMHGMLCRWTDDATHSLLKPVWRAICAKAGVALKWHAEEQYDELPNKARVYIRGLKTQDQTLRYAKFRGLTLSRVYVDQAEELPHDVYLELAARLSQKGFPHQITISPNAVEETHWIAREFPTDNRFLPQRKYISLSVHDNAHNLAPEVIPTLERLYPPSHPKHRTMVLGKRGLNVIGEPVYKGAFERKRHEGPAEFDATLRLLMALDFGKHHPCVVFKQISAFGQARFLAGILGQSLYLDAFMDLVLHYRALWFPGAIEIAECCDPAGATDTSHGTKGAVATLREKGVHPRSVPDSNSPIVRLAMIERMAGQMRKRAADGSEAFLVSNSDRWLRISADNVVVDRFLTDGFEAGYVWSPHTVSVNNKPVRVPKKDGWYEHGQNCAEYLEVNFGAPWKKPVEEEEPEPYRPVSPWG
ncbi:MAG TPA: phage terminase large subunit [Candidatus Limnocylindrales bacterium]|nr:phage terminase large subunit [Candidatus Limnocylindrales bacterium]